MSTEWTTPPNFQSHFHGMELAFASTYWCIVLALRFRQIDIQRKSWLGSAPESCISMKLDDRLLSAHSRATVHHFERPNFLIQKGVPLGYSLPYLLDCGRPAVVLLEGQTLAVT